MRLYRLCCPKEIEAIRNGGVQKFCFGASLYRYINVDEKANFENSYPYFQNMFNEIKNKKGEERIEPILKAFPDIPKETPLFEKDVLKRREIANQFNPKRFVFYGNKEYFRSFAGVENINKMLDEPSDLNDEIFLISIKLAGFFDSIHEVEQYYNSRYLWDRVKVLAIDVPDEIALKYKGTGVYDVIKFDCAHEEKLNEYALPMHTIKPEHVVADFNIFDETWQDFKE